MNAKETIIVNDEGRVSLKDRAEILEERVWQAEKSVVEIKGWVRCLMRENGKIVPGTLREDFNIWTNTGREWDGLKGTILTGTTTYRSDAIGYIGVGIGTQLETTAVLNLVTPVAYTGSLFLTALDPATFPLTPVRTSVRYSRTFVENEITTTSSPVSISELGLFTNGAPSASPAYNPGSRDLTLVNALQQAPVAYKTFDPIIKKNTLQFEVQWEIRR